jgi:hypothetical protein
MFADYQEDVLKDYERKKAANQLSIKLIHPTAAKLRTESIRVCEERYRKKDENILSSLFGQQENAEGYRQAIKRYDPDWFKPLYNFLKGITKSTDEENIELLAWLIDFEPRPFQIGYDYGKQKTMTTPPVSVGKTKEIIPKPEAGNNPTGKRKLSKKTRNLLIFLALLILSGIVTYLMWTGRQTDCMYWTGEHYERISCDQAHRSALIVPFNDFQFAYQKRITDTATINEKSVGHVWYFKSGKQVECYTAEGVYPPDTNRRLLPLTKYMVREHFHH